MFSALAVAPLASQKIVMADTVGCTGKKQNLVTLTQLIEDRKITPAIDRCYLFEQIPAAIRYQEQGHARGKVVVAV
jgi:NADPH:quinone reductase-like Zn-dependent oxidoreductase